MKIKIIVEADIQKDDEVDLKHEITYAVERYGMLKRMVADTWDY